MTARIRRGELISNDVCGLVHLIYASRKRSRQVQKRGDTFCVNFGGIDPAKVITDDVLIKAREIAALRNPSEGDYSSVKQWFLNNNPLLEAAGEVEWINWEEDMVSLYQGREWTSFDRLLITLIHRCKVSFVQNIFRTAELRKKLGADRSVQLYAYKRIETFVDLFLILILCAMLVLPIVAMSSLEISGLSSAYQSAVAVLIVFTLLFAVSMSLFAKAGRHEIFAAAAAYCAVLVVFISNFGASPHAGS
ncbi:MAG: hypothetical protein M1820_006062 [Bogoriella megaspora]|nr:MAG: hypothetical protein M1820_006062 [Bogoriella megaspora]